MAAEASYLEATDYPCLAAFLVKVPFQVTTWDNQAIMASFRVTFVEVSQLAGPLQAAEDTFATRAPYPVELAFLPFAGSQGPF